MPAESRGRRSNPQNHHFGGFDEGGGRLSRLQLHLPGGARRDNGRNLLATNRNLDLGHQAANADRFDSSDQLISSADVAAQQLSFFLGLGSGAEKQPVHFTHRYAVMSAGGTDAADLLLVNPLLDGGKADPQLQGRVAEL